MNGLLYRNRLTNPTVRQILRRTIPRQRFQHQPQHLLQQQERSASSFAGLFNIADRWKLLRLRQQMQNSPTELVKYDYLRTLVDVHPQQAISFLERSWDSGKLPVNEQYMKEYIKAAAALRKVDALNLSALLGMMLRTNNPAVLGAAGLNAEHLAQLTQSAAAAAVGSSSSGALFSAGRSPQEPLYIARPEVSWSSQAWGALRWTIGLFLLASFAGTFLDEKAAGGASAGSISSRLGMGSVVKRAEKSDKTFDDVVGIDEAKHELQEIVMYLKDPKRFTRLGGKLPKGVLLTGPPGTGKTLLARAIAGEAAVPFFHASGSEFEEMYVGVGAKRVRELFEVAKAKSPCIIFIDEIDAIGGSRQVKDQSAMKMTLNQLLVEMDGFAQNNGIIVIAATNFPDSLDSALVRPGRFDKHVDVPMPDLGGRKAILELYSKKVPMDKDVDMEQLARGTPGFSGAELFNLINQAALKASVENMKAVGMSALEYAKDKIMMGAERKSAVISPETMRMTAFHEAGHALVALLTDGADPIHKATIMPRGRALGMVMQLPDGDQTSMSRKQMIARLDVCMGGRVAEELVFGDDDVTSGASNDLMQATRLARAMVTKYGLSEKVGVVYIDDKGKNSGQMMKEVDEEVKELVTASYNRAKRLLELHRKELDLIAQGLMEYESLAGSEIVDAAKGKFPPRSGTRSQRPSRTAQAIPAQKGQIASAFIANSAAATSTTASTNAAVDATTSAATAATNLAGMTAAVVKKKTASSSSAPVVAANAGPASSSSSKTLAAPGAATTAPTASTAAATAATPSPPKQAYTASLFSAFSSVTGSNKSTTDRSSNASTSAPTAAAKAAPAVSAASNNNNSSAVKPAVSKSNSSGNSSRSE